MSDLRIKQQVSSVARATDDNKWMNLRGTRDGAMISVDWLTGMVLEGRCFGVNAGIGTTVQTFSPAFAATMPDLLVAVPSETTIIPVMIQVNMEDTGGADILDICALASSGYDITGLTDNDLTIYNMRMDAPETSLCAASAYVTAGLTSPYAGNFIEFWRGWGGKNADAFNGNTTPTNELITRTAWSLKDALSPPVIVGEGSLNVFASANAGLGFITAIWVEVPSNTIQ